MTSDYVIIFPFSSWSGRRWPEEKFILIAEHLLEKYKNLSVFICGGPKDSIKNLPDSLFKSSRVQNMVGETSLLELVRLVSKARLVVSNETSIIHIAAAHKIPSVCILGGGHFGRYLPYGTNIEEFLEPVSIYSKKECFGCNWDCSIEHTTEAVPCIESIEVSTVIKAIDQVLV